MRKFYAYEAYSLAISAPCAKYSLPTSAYSEPTLAASAAFSLRTSVASSTFSLKKMEDTNFIDHQIDSMILTLTISAP